MEEVIDDPDGEAAVGHAELPVEVVDIQFQMAHSHVQLVGQSIVLGDRSYFVELKIGCRQNHRIQTVFHAKTVGSRDDGVVRSDRLMRTHRAE